MNYINENDLMIQINRYVYNTFIKIDHSIWNNANPNLFGVALELKNRGESQFDHKLQLPIIMTLKVLM
jgi:hypothetical protein